MANKIKFGLKNVHYAKVTETYSDATGKWTSSYGDVKAWPGAVNLSLSAEGSDDTFYADDVGYYITSTNNGYSGSFESAIIPSDVQESILGQQRDDNGLLVEASTQKKSYVALMFEVDGDTKAARYCFYKCMLTRSSVEAQTKETSIDPKTDSVSIIALPRLDEDHYVKVVADSETTTGYTTFFDSVPVPTFTP